MKLVAVPKQVVENVNLAFGFVLNERTRLSDAAPQDVGPEFRVNFTIPFVMSLADGV